MRLKATIAVAGVLALAAFPALSVANHGEPHGKNGSAPHGKGPTYTPTDPTPGPKAGLPEQAKAYGRYCQGESRKHVKGEKGTPFSRCVTAMARAVNNENLSPGQACKGTSRKHVKGEKGTPFSRCVKAVAQAREGEGATTLVSYHPTYKPAPTPSPPAHAKAYGFYCKGQSKKHVKGEKGTAFSRCVRAMAKAAKHEKLAPGQACKGLSKKHAKGQKGTAFSRCVKGVAQMREDLQPATV